MGLGMIFPPIAVNLFISTSIAGVTYAQAIRASIPFILIMIVNIAILAVFPKIVSILPHLLLAIR
jgi:C4-dicarboxylate transporter DctM subunit